MKENINIIKRSENVTLGINIIEKKQHRSVNFVLFYC